MNEEDLVDLKTAMAEAEASGDYSTLDRMVRSTGTPEPTELSIRDRNVTAEEVADACAVMRSLKEAEDHVAVNEAQQIVAILRAAHREGEIEAGRRSAGVGIVTERN